MDLPAELRNSIYELALVGSTEEGQSWITKRRGPLPDESSRPRTLLEVSRIWINKLRGPPRDEPYRPRTLLEVSQQVRKETLQIYYSGNRFYIGTEEASDLHDWLYAIGPDALRCLQHLDIGDRGVQSSFGEAQAYKSWS